MNKPLEFRLSFYLSDQLVFYFKFSPEDMFQEKKGERETGMGCVLRAFPRGIKPAPSGVRMALPPTEPHGQGERPASILDIINYTGRNT